MDECRFSVACHEPRGMFRYCPKHLKWANENSGSRRDMRRNLGFCIYCKEPAVRGFTRCTRHLNSTRKHNTTWRKKNQAARGWVMKRVKV